MSTYDVTLPKFSPKTVDAVCIVLDGSSVRIGDVPSDAFRAWFIATTTTLIARLSAKTKAGAKGRAVADLVTMRREMRECVLVDTAMRWYVLNELASMVAVKKSGIAVFAVAEKVEGAR